MIGEQPAGLDRDLVAAVDQDDAVAGQRHERNCRRGLRGGREQGGHLRAGTGALPGPAGGFPDVDEFDRLGALAGFVAEQGRLLRAGDRQRPCRAGGIAEPVDLGAAQMAERLNLATTAAALHGGRIEAHRVFAGAHHYLPGRMCHARLITP